MEKKHKSILFMIGLVISTCIFTACTEEDLNGFATAYFDSADAVENGFTYVGSASSESSCSSMCGARGYTLYRYNYNTNSCYCK